MEVEVPNEPPVVDLIENATVLVRVCYIDCSTPVPGADVLVESAEGGYFVTSDESGQAQLDLVPGNYKIGAASDPSVTSESRSVQVKPGERIEHAITLYDSFRSWNTSVSVSAQDDSPVVFRFQLAESGELHEEYLKRMATFTMTLSWSTALAPTLDFQPCLGTTDNPRMYEGEPAGVEAVPGDYEATLTVAFSDLDSLLEQDLGAVIACATISSTLPASAPIDVSVEVEANILGLGFLSVS